MEVLGYPSYFEGTSFFGTNVWVQALCSYMILDKLVTMDQEKSHPKPKKSYNLHS